MRYGESARNQLAITMRAAMNDILKSAELVTSAVTALVA